MIAGRPNVGKSSLINALLGYQRSIVYDQPGTTRDVVTATTAIDGWPVQLIDTAGLRDSADTIEAEGVKRARDQMSSADLLLQVSDLSQPWQEPAAYDEPPPRLWIHNKADLPRHDGLPRPDGLEVSAEKGMGLASLIELVSRNLVPLPPDPGEAVPFLPQQITALRAARHLLDTRQTAAAAKQLAQILKRESPAEPDR